MPAGGKRVSHKDGRVSKPGKENADSGYHGTTEDEMDCGYGTYVHRVSEGKVVQAQKLGTAKPQETIPIYSPEDNGVSDGKRTTGGSFHSAKEAINAEVSSKGLSKPLGTITSKVHGKPDLKGRPSPGMTADKPMEAEPATSKDVGMADPTIEDEQNLLDSQLHLEDSRTQLEASSPVEPIVRKPSLSFTSIPAREPLPSKSSIGARISQSNNSEQPILRAAGLTGVSKIRTTGNSLVGMQSEKPNNDKENDSYMNLADKLKSRQSFEETENDSMTQLHRKTSTQRLHDRISQLGQSHPPRPTKSIPPSAHQVSQTDRSGPSYVFNQALGPAASNKTVGASSQQEFTDDENWISQNKAMLPAVRSSAIARKDPSQLYANKSGDQPINSMNNNILQLQDRVSSTDIQYPSLQTEATESAAPRKSASAPMVVSAVSVTAKPHAITGNDGPSTDTTTSSYKKAFSLQKQPTLPKNSQVSKGDAEGPLSASKAKLSSLLKSARGIFVSSAGVSAQAKMEAMSPSTMQLRSHASGPSIDAVIDGRLTDKPVVQKDLGTANRKSDSKAQESTRRTRSSTEKEEKRRAREAEESNRTEDLADKACELVAEKATAQKQKKAGIVAQKAREIEERRNPAPSVPKIATTLAHKASRKRKSTEEDNDVLKVNEPPAKFFAAESSQHSGTDIESSQSQSQPSGLNAKDARRPPRPGKVVSSKAKPVPVAIKVGTASQIELDQRKVRWPDLIGNGN